MNLDRGSPASRRISDTRDRLVISIVAGRVAPPRVHPQLIAHDATGHNFMLPGSGGVHPLVHAGDPVDSWLSDHLLPGASAEDATVGPAEPGAFHLLACVGNRVLDGSGRALGVVAGKRGGLAPGYWPPNLVGIEAPRERLERLSPGDPLRLEATGRGLAVEGHPGVALSNVSPRLLDALPLEADAARLIVAVSALVPSRAAGSGLGQDPWIGDLEIAFGPAAHDLRFGDLVAFEGIDSATTRFHRPGHISVGIVAHGPGLAPGHGVGVTMLLTGAADALEVRVVRDTGLGPVLREWGADP
jgi:uncharacterized protein DUF4438